MFSPRLSALPPPLFSPSEPVPDPLAAEGLLFAPTPDRVDLPPVAGQKRGFAEIHVGLRPPPYSPRPAQRRRLTRTLGPMRDVCASPPSLPLASLRHGALAERTRGLLQIKQGLVERKPTAIVEVVSSLGGSDALQLDDETRLSLGLLALAEGAGAAGLNQRQTELFLGLPALLETDILPDTSPVVRQLILVAAEAQLPEALRLLLEHARRGQMHAVGLSFHDDTFFQRALRFASESDGVPELMLIQRLLMVAQTQSDEGVVFDIPMDWTPVGTPR